MKLPAPQAAILKTILTSLRDICLDLYPLVDENTLHRLNGVNKLVGRLKLLAELDEQMPVVPVFSDVNELAAILKRRRAEDEQAWKELLDESTPRQ